MEYDILVIGGGHAGVEAAWISMQFGLKVGLVTMPGVGIASAPCNPAVGGVGKGQVVREIDALGGLMGRLTDLSAIQYRTLNESKGYAVQSTRAQVDKDLYSKNAEKIIGDSNISIIRDKIIKINFNSGSYIVSGSAGDYSGNKIIITTGTFLNGEMHTGETVTSGGRVDCDSSESLGNLFDNIKSLKKRFKTGTPPRIVGSTIDFSKMTAQESDKTSLNFHYGNTANKRIVSQVSCHLTRTNEATLKIIRDNKSKSPIFNGQIKGIGPRYCPSIEDKAYRYTDKDVHHVFVEPETLNMDTYYPNGISTSLPVEVQEEFLRTISGLENAKIAVKGYAVEYDVVDTTELSPTLEYISSPGLYFSGQVCGTSGYEEAAGQGIVSGINASLSFLGKEPLIVDRDDSYIGVMVDDLTNNVRDEPYRLFTARSENRLMIREDNATLRMSKYRRILGLNAEVDVYNKKYNTEYTMLLGVVNKISYVSGKDERMFNTLSLGKIKGKLLLTELLKRSSIDPVDMLSNILDYSGISMDLRVIRNVAIDTKYSGYIKRSEVEINKLNKLGHKKIKINSLVTNDNLSFECRQRIDKIKPVTFGQLQRIEGIRPATLAYVAANCI
jgi:tRNA uridine 5-carboxymethylaminomethyl modification enzyme